MASNTSGRNRRAVFVGLGMLAGILALGGCVSYTNVPVPESAPAFKSMNHTQSISVVAKALESVVSKHPLRDAQGRYAINLPTGTTPQTAQRIIDRLPEGAIIPFAGMSPEMPIYHVGRVWIRASDAKVDVIYPFIRVDGAREDQSVTIWLNGGVRKWRVNRQQYWAPGTIQELPIYIPITPDDEVGDDASDDTGDEIGQAILEDDQPEPSIEDAGDEENEEASGND